MAKTRKRRLHAGASKKGAMLLTAVAEVGFAAAAKGGKARPTFEIAAYAGGSLRLEGWYVPVVIDLKGLRADAHVAVLKDHDRAQIVGQGTAVIGRQDVSLSGIITGDHEAPGTPANEVVTHARNGFTWPASVGVAPERVEDVSAGTKVRVNGRTFAGPLAVVRRGRLGEVSLVAVGADETAVAQIAARYRQGGGAMNEFEKWLKAMGLDKEELSEEQMVKLQAKFDAEDVEEEESAPVKKVRARKATAEPAESGPAPGAVEAQIMRAELAIAVEAAAAKASKGCGIEQLLRIKAAKDLAITEGWSLEKVEAEIALAKRPIQIAVQTHDWVAGVSKEAVIEASLAMATGLRGAEKAYPEEVLAAAKKRWHGNIGLKEALVLAANANGAERVTHSSSPQELLRGAFPGSVQAAAGFSTIDIGGILSNVANKFLLEGFLATEQTWRRICGVASARDFKLMRSYRLTGDDTYRQMAPGGEFEHGSLDEEVLYNQVATYGRMFTIDRQDIINDDLNAMSAIPRKLGRGSGNAINDVFWAAFLDDAAFFTALLGNLIEGTDSALSVDGLTAAETDFYEQVDADGRPIGIPPAILLVPAALKTIAKQLVTAQELRQGGDDAYPTANPHQNGFTVEVSSYLSNAAVEGYSATAWYILADPNVLPVIQVAFLDGREAPTIETATADFNNLGIRMRGYHDFGVALQDGRGGVKSTGAAESS